MTIWWNSSKRRYIATDRQKEYGNFASLKGATLCFPNARVDRMATINEMEIGR